MNDVEIRPYPKMPQYLVSQDGRVISTNFKMTGQRRELSPWVSNLGYKMVRLSGEHRGLYSIHRLVAQTFIPNPLSLSEVNHIDGNKLNNHASNLEWCSKRDNMIHAHVTGLAKNIQGSRNHNALIDETKAAAIWQFAQTQEGRAMNNRQVAEKFSCSRATVTKIRRGESWRHVCN